MYPFIFFHHIYTKIFELYFKHFSTEKSHSSFKLTNCTDLLLHLNATNSVSLVQISQPLFRFCNYRRKVIIFNQVHLRTFTLVNDLNQYV